MKIKPVIDGILFGVVSLGFNQFIFGYEPTHYEMFLHVMLGISLMRGAYNESQNRN